MRCQPVADEFIQRVASKKRVTVTTRALAGLNAQHMQALEQVWMLTNQVRRLAGAIHGPGLLS